MQNIGHCSTLNAMQFDYFIQQDAFCVAKVCKTYSSKLLTAKQFPQKAK